MSYFQTFSRFQNFFWKILRSTGVFYLEKHDLEISFFFRINQGRKITGRRQVYQFSCSFSTLT